MPFYRVNGLMVHLNLGGKLRKNPPAPCCAPTTLDGKRVRCCAISSFLCDWDLSDGKTCDAPLCHDHAVEIGRDRHLCPRHAAQRAEIQPELI
jgi:hypothetical protein